MEIMDKIKDHLLNLKLEDRDMVNIVSEFGSSLSGSDYLEFLYNFNFDEEYGEHMDVSTFKIRISDHDLPPSYYNQRDDHKYTFNISINGFIGEGTDVSTDCPDVAVAEFQKWFAVKLQEEKGYMTT